MNNPIEREASSLECLLAEFLIKNPRMTRFCKVPVTEALQLHAVYQAQYKFEKSEEERKAKEAAEAAAAAAEDQ